MSDDGTTFEIDINAKADSAAEAAAIVARLSSKLDEATKASSAAADAVKAADAAYATVEKTADAAAKSLEKINQKVDAQREKVAKLAEGSDGVVNVAAYRKAEAALQQLLQRQTEASSTAAKSKGAVEAEAVALDKLKAAAGAAADNVAKIAKAEQAAKTAADGFAKTEKAAADAAKKAADTQAKAAKESADASAKVAQAAAGSGKVNEIGEALGKLGGPLGQVGQKVFGAAEGFKKMSASLGSAGPYVALAVGLVAIAAGATAAAAAVAGVTLSILKFAVANADAARSEALLAAQAAGGAEGLAATAQLALSLDNQAKKLKADISKIFSIGQPQLQRFLEGLAKLGALFDENSVTAQAIKVVFSSVFDPLLDGITELIPKVVAGFIQFEIMALKALIAIKPYGSTILTVAKYAGILALVVGGALALAIGVVAAGVAAMAVGFAVLIAAIVAVVAAVIWVGAQFVAFGNAVYEGAGAAIDWLKGKFDEAVAWLSGLSLSEIGTNLINGLVEGITGAAGGVVKAVTGAVTGAIDAAKSALGIASPSKVFAEIGGYTAEGMAGGVDDGATDVQKSLESMVSPPDAAPTLAGIAGKGGSGGGLTIAPGAITITGIAGAESIVPQLIAALEGWAAQSGGARAATAT